MPYSTLDIAGTLHVQKITVSFDYPVYFTTQVFSPGNPSLAAALSWKEPARCHRAVLVVDATMATHWPDLLGDMYRYADVHRDQMALIADPLLVEGGEAVKNNYSAVTTLQAQLDVLGMDRHSFVVTVGGGSVQDMAGYAAATLHRGLRVVRVPTTVLAQADAGLGVKNGINAFGKKNCLGTFMPPFAVLNDRRFLESLSRRDMIAGMAEAVKVALIRDAPFFHWLLQHVDELAACDHEAMQILIRWSAQLHLDHIETSGDPFELGSARPLDFGHWAAHKLECLSSYRLRHGEAVAIGMALDTLYSADAGLLPEQAVEPVIGLLERLGFRLWDTSLEDQGADGRLAILDGLVEFQQHLGGELSVSLLAAIGHGVEVKRIHEEGILRSLQWLHNRDKVRS